MRLARFAVWTGMLTLCVLFWVWVASLVAAWLSPAAITPRPPTPEAPRVMHARITYPAEMAGEVVEIRMVERR
tara:strand:- start:2728 stop:2946 length:219 start_codon:yes stop_codon:yes gene_type:complete